MDVGISPSVSCADSSLIRGSRGSLEVGLAYGIRRDADCHGPKGPRNDRGILRAFSVLHVILSDPERSRRGVEESVPLWEVAGMRVLRRAALAQDDRENLIAGSSDCHSERSIVRCGVEESVTLIVNCPLSIVN